MHFRPEMLDSFRIESRILMMVAGVSEVGSLLIVGSRNATVCMEPSMDFCRWKRPREEPSVKSVVAGKCKNSASFV